MIYHITTPEAWDEAKHTGAYQADSLTTEGFIHCSTAEQVANVANTLFRGARGLIPRHIDPARLTSPLTYENLKGGDENIGATGLQPSFLNRAAELAYWVGVPFWNKGCGTEAARALVAYGFGTLGLHRIYARHMTNNPASGRMMQKLGMSYEGPLRHAAYRFGTFSDLAMYGLLRTEYEEAQKAPGNDSGRALEVRKQTESNERRDDGGREITGG